MKRPLPHHQAARAKRARGGAGITGALNRNLITGWRQYCRASSRTRRTK